LKGLTKLPECIFVIDMIDNKLAIKEARNKKVPIISLVDTNGDPEKINYPIPANDDAIASLELMLAVVSEKIKDVNK